MSPIAPPSVNAQIFRRYYDSYDDDYNRSVTIGVGVWVGIVIGIVVFKILLIAAICYLCKRKDRKRRQDRMTNPLYKAPGYAPLPPNHAPAEYTGYYSSQQSGKTQPDVSYTMPAVPDATYIETARPDEIHSHHSHHGHHGHDPTHGQDSAMSSHGHHSAAAAPGGMGGMSGMGGI